MPGLGAKVLKKAGGSAVLSPGSEIYTNLERGVIDATEWIGPYHDYKMGFHKIAKYCYYPGWHEPGTMLEIMINKSTFERLPKDLQSIVRSAVARLNIWTLAQFEAQNAIFLDKMQQEGKVEFLAYPEEVLKHLKGLTEEVINELIASDEMSKKVFDSYQSFRSKIQPWGEMTEKMYYNW